ncbi:MAG: DCC1-like thiol-disulfide oxidoreductase family protein [Burkholderiaceae bacterium]
MSSIYPLTLLYDATCPVCALEMDHLRSRNAAGQLVFVDRSHPALRLHDKERDIV